jgi:hypothetical protein
MFSSVLLASPAHGRTNSVSSVSSASDVSKVRNAGATSVAPVETTDADLTYLKPFIILLTPYV